MAFCVLVLTVCATFAKALIEGNGVKLSGDDSFKTIVVPLCKALSYSKKVSTKGQGRTPRPSFILCACVVDAPMLLVDDLKNPKEPIFTPWIRLVRQEANKKIGPMENPYENYYVDVVHSAYFESNESKTKRKLSYH